MHSRGGGGGMWYIDRVGRVDRVNRIGWEG